MKQFNGKGKEQASKVGSIEGQVLCDKYKVGRQIGQGSFGFVHKVKYVNAAAKEQNQDMVIKASFDLGQLYNEVQALMQIHQFANENKKYKDTISSIPQRLDHGLLYVDKDEIQSYYGMKDKPQPNADVA